MIYRIIASVVLIIILGLFVVNNQESTETTPQFSATPSSDENNMKSLKIN